MLFLVPSISLLSQTLREWTAQSSTRLRPFAVCSDIKVSRNVRGHQPHDSRAGHHRPGEAGSAMPARAERQVWADGGLLHLPVAAGGRTRPRQLGLADFDLVICDEAHRTTGVTLAGEDESNFVKIHDATYIRRRKRLYMTATPRLFDEAGQGQGRRIPAVLASMDDETTFGPEFHRLGFGDAVERGLLTDYKVLVLPWTRSTSPGRSSSSGRLQRASSTSTTPPRSWAAGTAWPNGPEPT